MGMMSVLAPTTVQTLTDELDRYVVQLPDAGDHWVAPYLAITRDRTGKSERLTVVTREACTVFLRPYELFGILCHGRAQQCVDRTVRIDGKVATPETYLRAWRASLAAPKPWPFLEQIGLVLSATLRGDPKRIDQQAKRWRPDLGVRQTLHEVFGAQCLEAESEVNQVAHIHSPSLAAQISFLQWALADGGGASRALLVFKLGLQVTTQASQASSEPGVLA